MIFFLLGGVMGDVGVTRAQVSSQLRLTASLTLYDSALFIVSELEHSRTARVVTSITCRIVVW